MEIYEHQPGYQVRQHWLLSFSVLVLLVFGALAILQTLAVGLIPFLFGIGFDQLPALLSGTLNHPNGRMAFLFIQGLGGGLAFWLGGWLFIRLVDKKTMRLSRQFSPEKLHEIGLVFPILIGFVLFNSLWVYLNMNMEFPEAWKGLETLLREKEDQLMELTLYLTDFASTGELLMGILVIGVLAGIGEEYLFRGIVQPKMHAYTQNAHLAVWLTALIFSAIHFQFYGFLPRMMLGALFGYLYLYSGTLVFPILAHILNNTFTLFLVYFNKLNLIDYDMENATELHWEYVLIGGVVFLLSWKRFLSRQKTQTHA
ncbi:hypothetical protein SAMN05192553_102389 [Cyclobacterium xiamenense]|uniref:CAAX prenyl protease 2/Lysostaphin resistance protein A-like domain-containing protein n=1 Tax=Cyclobacterium xiamenense TaxID=1297121 RepID=A0A1H6W052_9BACT|nr:CPBP family intramembrane glutamic endopeptidase [Cyclobacterium xiamenense]SEJ10299.1 hypothetical protein SAMN05192553_102389 [Cyclobacterium xiamenense]